MKAEENEIQISREKKAARTFLISPRRFRPFCQLLQKRKKKWKKGYAGIIIIIIVPRAHAANAKRRLPFLAATLYGITLSPAIRAKDAN